MKAKLVLLGVFFLLVGCTASDDDRPYVDFITAIGDANGRLKSSGDKFGRLLQPALDGDKANVPKLRPALDRMKATLAAAKTQVGALTVPGDQVSQAYHAAEMNLLDDEERLIADLERIIEVLEGPGELTAKREHILKLLADANEKEKADLQKLQSVQTTFAAQHHITIR